MCLLYKTYSFASTITTKLRGRSNITYHTTYILNGPMPSTSDITISFEKCNHKRTLLSVY